MKYRALAIAIMVLVAPVFALDGDPRTNPFGLMLLQRHDHASDEQRLRPDLGAREPRFSRTCRSANRRRRAWSSTSRIGSTKASL